MKAHAALFAANLIYGLNYSVAKDVMPEYIQPFGFILLRVLGASLLFWFFHSLLSNEKIDKKDWPRIALCGLFGVAMNQLLFFAGLNITTPINAAIIMTSNPILVLIAASIILHEVITKQKILGLSLGVIGALLIIIFKADFSFDSTTWPGDVMILMNAASYGVYLVIVKPLMTKYQPLTIIKWVFTFGVLYVIPFGFYDFMAIEWSSFTTTIWLETAFVVICTTFFAYLLNIFALKKLQPSTVSTYIYTQPVLASFFAIIMGKDELSLVKIVGAVLIFTGVYIVSKRFT
ncbi:MAG: EamA family transporter [Crocinitomicaceae bacterium]|nr:EamA family transporter [Crocinitomicaceae bacterium]